MQIPTIGSLEPAAHWNCPLFIRFYGVATAIFHKPWFFLPRVSAILGAYLGMMFYILMPPVSNSQCPPTPFDTEKSCPQFARVQSGDFAKNALSTKV